MKYCFFFGPDKTTFEMEKSGIAEQSSAIPFHGIVSRGLLNTLIKEDPEGILWHQYAHMLDEIQSQCKPESESIPELKRLSEYAKNNNVLSFSQSALCAKKYIEMFSNSYQCSNNLICELWNIKEGHTSSVWKCSILLNNVPQPFDKFILNVARDTTAGIELKASSIKMQEIAMHCAGTNIARVLDIQSVSLDYYGSEIEVIVSKNECVDNCFEIHKVFDKKSNQEQLLLVERFLINQNNPARITSIFGRRFTDIESNKIKNDIKYFMSNVPSDFKAEINIQEGDVVWDGKRAVVVAIS